MPQDVVDHPKFQLPRNAALCLCSAAPETGCVRISQLEVATESNLLEALQWRWAVAAGLNAWKIAKAMADCSNVSYPSMSPVSPELTADVRRAKFGCVLLEG